MTDSRSSALTASMFSAKGHTRSIIRKVQVNEMKKALILTLTYSILFSVLDFLCILSSKWFFRGLWPWRSFPPGLVCGRTPVTRCDWLCRGLLR